MVVGEGTTIVHLGEVSFAIRHVCEFLFVEFESGAVRNQLVKAAFAPNASGRRSVCVLNSPHFWVRAMNRFGVQTGGPVCRERRDRQQEVYDSVYPVKMQMDPMRGGRALNVAAWMWLLYRHAE